MHRTGFDGKLPGCGDFIGRGLPAGFLVPWRAWLDRVLDHGMRALGEGWRAAWMEAPVWHFRLQPGIAGPDAALGLMFPSVDRVGRHYPMTIATLPGRVSPSDEAAAAWRIAAEAAGLAALAHSRSPDMLEAALAAIAVPAGGGSPPDGSVWWTEGAPLVPSARFALDRLPEPARFQSMVGPA